MCGYVREVGGRKGQGWKDRTGSVPLSNCLANSRTALILVLGFHSLSLSMPRHMLPLLGGESLLIFGWYTLVVKVTVGGLKG